MGRKASPKPKPSNRSRKDNASACPKILKAAAITVEDAVDFLRGWRTAHPSSTQLDGRSGNNPEHWLHIRVDGYDRETFTSRYGRTFHGQDYNGVVNFHGDTSAASVDRFIELIDAAEDYRDVLRPSATYETRKKPTRAPVKPKLALQGYNDKVEGFFLYYDDWRQDKVRLVNS